MKQDKLKNEEYWLVIRDIHERIEGGYLPITDMATFTHRIEALHLKTQVSIKEIYKDLERGQQK